MNEKDFSLDLWGKEIYWKGEKVVVNDLRINIDESKLIGFKEKPFLYDFTKIMHELSFEPPFEIYENCKHHKVDNGHNKCVERKIILRGGTLSNVGNCFNCPDYEKEEKLKKLYLVGDLDTNESYFEKEEGWAESKAYVRYAKVCPDTNRIYIECEVENE